MVELLSLGYLGLCYRGYIIKACLKWGSYTDLARTKSPLYTVQEHSCTTIILGCKQAHTVHLIKKVYVLRPYVPTVLRPCAPESNTLVHTPLHPPSKSEIK